MSLSPFLSRRFKAISALAAAEPLAQILVPGELKRVVNVSEGKSPGAQAARREQQREYKSRGRGIAQQLDLQRLYIEHGPLVVRLVRVSPQSMDGDNLEAALKRVRDGIAEIIGIDDRESAVEYVADQRKGTPRQKALQVEVYRQLAGDEAPPQANAKNHRLARPKAPARAQYATVGGRLVRVTPNVTRAAR